MNRAPDIFRLVDASDKPVPLRSRPAALRLEIIDVEGRVFPTGKRQPDGIKQLSKTWTVPAFEALPSTM
ncbi:hypothetical protein IWX75_000458 [Arthrobacter sp. CAN_A6]|uniref:hypothetical protein n=1 Tax=Arthrobacter sp. CAN_A6 TaxID=2787721 RepID=UPI0018C96BD0